MTVFFTVGHSTRSADEFVTLLHEAGVKAIADVRKMPRSRRHPQFSQEALDHTLAAAGIGYVHFPELGGLRPRQRAVARDVNGSWRNDSFHNYADYALGPEFHAGLERLKVLGRETPTAVMCAEALVSQCHRRIIADHLIAGGDTVKHVVRLGAIIDGVLAPEACVGDDGRVTYPADQPCLL